MGFKVEKDDNPSFFKDFQKLLARTTPHKKLTKINLNQIAYQYQFFKKNDRIKIYKAIDNNQEVVAVTMVVDCKPTICRWLEVSDSKFENSDKAVDFLNALIMLESKKKGFESYQVRRTLIDKINHKKRTEMDHFAKKFAGERLEYMPTFDLIVKPKSYYLAKPIKLLLKR